MFNLLLSYFTSVYYKGKLIFLHIGKENLDYLIHWK